MFGRASIATKASAAAALRSVARLHPTVSTSACRPASAVLTSSLQTWRQSSPAPRWSSPRSLRAYNTARAARATFEPVPESAPASTKPARPAELPALTPLEHTAPLVYVRLIYPFELPENYDIEETSRILATAYEGLKKRIPIVGSYHVPVRQENGSIRQVLEYAREDDHADFVVNDLRAPGAFPMSYKEFKEKKFPIDVLDADKLFKFNSVWFSPLERNPASFMQVNFIDGGMLLSWKCNHLIMDGTSLGVWAEVFSEECRKAQGLTVENPINEAELYSSRPLMHQDRKDRQVTIEDAKGVDHWPVAESLPPVVTATDWQAAVFYMSRENQKKIKADATPANATIPNNVPWISTNDAIDALIWRTLTMAQGKPVNPEEQSIFTIAVDGRRKVDMDIHPRLLGSMLQVVAADATLGKIYDGSYTLADLAILHRRAVMYTMSRKSIEDVTALQQKLWAENPEIMLVPQGVDKMPRAFQFVTSWAGWDLPAFDFGPKIGRVQAVRVPSNGYFNGINVIFPKLPDGGLEIMIAQPKEQMERVKADPFFGKYAVLR